MGNTRRSKFRWTCFRKREADREGRNRKTIRSTKKAHPGIRSKLTIIVLVDHIGLWVQEDGEDDDQARARVSIHIHNKKKVHDLQSDWIRIGHRGHDKFRGIHHRQQISNSRSQAGWRRIRNSRILKVRNRWHLTSSDGSTTSTWTEALLGMRFLISQHSRFHWCPLWSCTTWWRRCSCSQRFLGMLRGWLTKRPLQMDIAADNKKAVHSCQLCGDFPPTRPIKLKPYVSNHWPDVLTYFATFASKTALRQNRTRHVQSVKYRLKDGRNPRLLSSQSWEVHLNRAN